MLERFGSSPRQGNPDELFASELMEALRSRSRRGRKPDGEPTPAEPVDRLPDPPPPPMRSVLKKSGDLAYTNRNIQPYPQWYSPSAQEEEELRMRRRGMLQDPTPDPDGPDLEPPVVEGVPAPQPGATPRRPGAPEPEGLFRQGPPSPPMRPAGDDTPDWYRSQDDGTKVAFRRQRQPMPSLDGYKPGLQGLLG